MKNFKILHVFLLLITLLFLSSCAALRERMAAKDVLLRYKFVPKETLRYQTVLQGIGNTKVIKNEKEAFTRQVKFTQTLQFSQTPILKMDNFNKIELKYSDIDIDVTIDGQKKPNITENLKLSKQALLGQPVYFLKDEQGVIKDVEGVNQIVQEFMKVKPLGDERDIFISSSIMRSLGQFIQRAVSQNVQAFPANPVKLGYNWRDEVVQDVPFMGKIKSTYTGKFVGLTKVKGKLCAKIYYTHEMKSLENKPEGQAVTAGFVQEISGKGYHYFSVDGDRTAYLIKTTSTIVSNLMMDREMTNASGAKETVRNITQMKLESVSELLE